MRWGAGGSGKAAEFSSGFGEPTRQPGGALQMGIWSGAWASGLSQEVIDLRVIRILG